MTPHTVNNPNKVNLSKDCSIGDIYSKLKRVAARSEYPSETTLLYQERENNNKIKMTNEQHQGAKMKIAKDSKLGLRGEECKICQDNVAENEKGINCDLCENWYHCKCIKMNDAIYKFYSKENQPWACSKCIENKREKNELYDLVMNMMKNNEEEREERALMMSMMKKMCEQLSGLEKIMEDKINKKLKKNENDLLIKVNEEMEESLEKFKRRKNLVIYGMIEKKCENEKEKCEADCMNIKKLLRELNMDIKYFEISRLGKQNTKGKPRPIRIELNKESEKYEILRNAAKLRFTENEDLKKVIINTDMSLKEREFQKVLREELKERRQAGERNIKIRKGRIVRTDEGGEEQN